MTLFFIPLRIYHDREHNAGCDHHRRIQDHVAGIHGISEHFCPEGKGIADGAHKGAVVQTADVAVDVVEDPSHQCIPKQDRNMASREEIAHRLHVFRKGRYRYVRADHETGYGGKDAEESAAGGHVKGKNGGLS